MMKRTSFAILFYIRRSKPTAQGECPVYVRISVNKQRIEFSLKETIPPDIWDSKANRAYDTEQKGCELNETIQNTIDKLRNCKRQLEADLKPVTPRNLRNLFFDIDETTVFLLEQFMEHNKRCERLVDIDIRHSMEKSVILTTLCRF
ncbi:MAG TPA: Arm DNA-binding domain-containing protein [Bacteroidales bacterium]|nr:Arm DNA-binding domain-containing protein [Bacteroidales bacterium]